MIFFFFIYCYIICDSYQDYILGVYPLPLHGSTLSGHCRENYISSSEGIANCNEGLRLRLCYRDDLL